MMTTIDSTFEAIVAEQKLAEAAARSTDCGVQGCDGTFHRAGEDPPSWQHRVECNAENVLQAEVIVDEEGRVYAEILAAFDEDTFCGMDGDAVRALADKIEAEPARLRALADRIDLLSLPEQRVGAVAGNVAAALTRHGAFGGPKANAGALVEILEVSENRARDLWSTRKPFTSDELRLLSAYFDCEVSDWMTQRGPQRTYPMDVAAAEDRLMTARESNRT